MTPGDAASDMSERQAHGEATYERLFGQRDGSAHDDDPELMEILRRFIFGDVFDTGVLDDRTRELITVTVLACLQSLPQLKSHTAAALNVGAQPVEIREAIYQLAPFIGFPRTLNAVASMNEALHDQGIELPLPAQGTVSDADRYARGLAEQAPLYGNEIKDNLADLPEPFNEALPRFLTEFCFGDFYTRGGLTLAQRELLVLCSLATIGDTSASSAPTAAPACKSATRRPPWSPHWCTASPTSGSRAPSPPSGRSRASRQVRLSCPHRGAMTKPTTMHEARSTPRHRGTTTQPTQEASKLLRDKTVLHPY